MDDGLERACVARARAWMRGRRRRRRDDDVVDGDDFDFDDDGAARVEAWRAIVREERAKRRKVCGGDDDAREVEEEEEEDDEDVALSPREAEEEVAYWSDTAGFSRCTVDAASHPLGRRCAVCWLVAREVGLAYVPGFGVAADGVGALLLEPW